LKLGADVVEPRPDRRQLLLERDRLALELGDVLQELGV
jgi:hypothetical protein